MSNRNLQVTVLLADAETHRAAAGRDPYDPAFGDYTEAAKFDATVTLPGADGFLEACEIAFAVCNSFVGELHCEMVYADEVASYRDRGNRSLSVGDLVVIGEATFRCESFGFKGVPAPVAA